jgi:LPXTG-motif cell wall-anchored protein
VYGGILPVTGFNGMAIGLVGAALLFGGFLTLRISRARMRRTEDDETRR